jgi:hypothetical protein
MAFAGPRPYCRIVKELLDLEYATMPLGWEILQVGTE